MKFENFVKSGDLVSVDIYTESGILHGKWSNVNIKFLIKNFERSDFYVEITKQLE